MVVVEFDLWLWAGKARPGVALALQNEGQARQGRDRVCRG
jgi:hypothetical protein